KADVSATSRVLKPARHHHRHRVESHLPERTQNPIVYYKVPQRLQGTARHQRSATQERGDGKDPARAIAVQQPAAQGRPANRHEHIDRVWTGAAGTAPGEFFHKSIVKDGEATADAAAPG